MERLENDEFVALCAAWEAQKSSGHSAADRALYRALTQKALYNVASSCVSLVTCKFPQFKRSLNIADPRPYSSKSSLSSFVVSFLNLLSDEDWRKLRLGSKKRPDAAHSASSSQGSSTSVVRQKKKKRLSLPVARAAPPPQPPSRSHVLIDLVSSDEEGAASETRSSEEAKVEPREPVQAELSPEDRIKVLRLKNFGFGEAEARLAIQRHPFNMAQAIAFAATHRATIIDAENARQVAILSEQEHAEHCARKEREARAQLFNSETLDLSIFPNSVFLGEHGGVAEIRAALGRPLIKYIEDDAMDYRSDVINLMLCEQNAYKWHGDSAKPFMRAMADRLTIASSSGPFASAVHDELGRMNNALYGLDGHLEFFQCVENGDDDVMLVADEGGECEVVDLSA